MAYSNEKGMWDELQQFVDYVEQEKQHTGSTKPYIEQIKNILLKNRAAKTSIEE